MHFFNNLSDFVSYLPCNLSPIRESKSAERKAVKITPKININSEFIRRYAANPIIEAPRIDPNVPIIVIPPERPCSIG